MCDARMRKIKVSILTYRAAWEVAFAISAYIEPHIERITRASLRSFVAADIRFFSRGSADDQLNVNTNKPTLIPTRCVMSCSGFRAGGLESWLLRLREPAGADDNADRLQRHIMRTIT